MSFTDRKPFVLDEPTLASFQRRKFRKFNCPLCGKSFQLGDTARFIYANFKESPVACGNFIVCSSCDNPDDGVVLQNAKVSYEQAVKLSKQWGIYGPDWQDAALYYDRRP